MQAEQIHDCVVNSVLALERMAFVIAEPLKVDPARVLPEAVHCAVITIDGPRKGYLLIAGTPGILREAAGGMLGVEPEEIDLGEHGDATVLELANVLGGHMIHEYGGEDVEWKLCLPEIVDMATAQAHLDRATREGFGSVVGSDTGRLVLAGVMPEDL